MTTTEFRKKVAESEDKDWLNSLSFTLSYPPSKFSREFTGISSFYQFLSNQVKGWAKLGNDIPSALKKSASHFEDIKNRVETLPDISIQSIRNGWNNIQNDLSRYNNDKPIFNYDAPIVQFLIDLHRDYPNYVRGAIFYLTDNLNSSRINNKNELTGAFMAYEFEQQDHTKITQRRGKERASINKIRSDLGNQLNELEQQVINHLAETNKKYTEYTQKIDTLTHEKEESFNTWFEANQKMFSEFEKDSKERKEELEKTYQKHLLLKAPAEYWEKRANKLRKQGWIAFAGLLLFVGIVIWLLGELLWKTPEQIYISFFDSDKSAAIRWSIIYVTFISFMAFCIRAIAKVMFSSFHLARDSEERNALTYFYLSLLTQIMQ